MKRGKIFTLPCTCQVDPCLVCNGSKVVGIQSVIVTKPKGDVEKENK